MTRAQFVDGVPFAVFGVPGYLKYDAAIDLLLIKEPNRTTRQSTVIFGDGDGDYFSARLPVFGIRQTVMISFAACEEKK